MEILFIDDHVVVVNKPAGMLVHKTKIAADVKSGFALQTVRDQIGKKVFPVHRLDRPTSGVLLFALNSESANILMKQFDDKTIHKQYCCVVRGFVEKEGTIDDPLEKENGNLQESTTNFKLISHFELPIANGKFSTTRYSLVEVTPKTGRMHQIRRHFAKKRNYLIGDTKYGNLKSNRAFQQYCSIEGLKLHAKNLEFTNPESKERILISASLPDKFQTIESIIKDLNGAE